ncbi:MAG: M48 family metalloprotease, partial [Lacisediminimonas sp.]|nr:M48 family metalloprotease [Lacisediminimonas sp.]
REEVEAVLGHEVAHIANGDMVTMTLIQGVVNTFVVFLSRVVGYAVDRAISRGDNSSGPGVGYMVTVVVCQIVFGIAASIIVAWFSRHREFRADAGAAQLMGTPQPMMKALARLGGIEPSSLPQGLASLGINDKQGFMALFSSHPPIEDRIEALRSNAR